MKMTNLDRAIEILGDNFVSVGGYYGNGYHGELTKIYVKHHVFDHTELNKLGYGIVVKGRVI